MDGSIGTAGKGAMVSEEQAYTVACSQDQTVICRASDAANAETCVDMAPALLARMHKQAPIVLDRASFNQGGHAMYDPHIERTDTMDTLVARGPHAVATQYGDEMAGTLTARHDSSPCADRGQNVVAISDGSQWVVRRLTPTECERLQGFPDGWTDIGEWVDSKGKKRKCTDGNRYKAIGNSMAVPCMRFIAERIEEVQRILDENS